MALALASQNTWGTASSHLTTLCLYVGTRMEKRSSLLSAFYNQSWPLQNCLVWEKGKDAPQRKCKPNLALLWKLGVYTEACRFPPPTSTPMGGTVSPTLFQGDRHEPRADVLFPALMHQLPQQPWWQPLKLNSVKCFGDDTFPLYAEKNLSTLKKEKPKYKVPPTAKGRHSTFRRYPAEGRGQQTDCSVWPPCSELKEKKEFDACEFWCSLKDAELESSGQSRVLFSQETTVLLPELYWKRPPFWGATKASHQTSKTACKTLPLGIGLSAPIHPIGNICSFSHLMGSEKRFAADCI